MTTLAVLGGPPAVTHPAPNWPAVMPADTAAVLSALQGSATDVANLTSVLAGGVVADFERALSDYFGGAHCVTTNSGGAALHAALMALGVGAGDEVIVSPYTWGQSVACVLQQCAIPVFADIDPRTYTLDPDAVAAVVSPYTRAIVVPHIFGQPADLARIMEVARAHHLYVVEDCAQAAGAAIGTDPVGTIGDIGCFSIGSGKQMVGGEGGFVVTRDAELFDRLLIASQHPARCAVDVSSPEIRELSDSFIYTYRIHPLAAAIGASQLPRLDGWNDCRRRQLQDFSAHLAAVPGVEPVYEPGGNRHVYHSYSPTYHPEELDGLDRDTFVRALRAEGVPIAPSYVGTPLHLTARMRERRWQFGGGLPWSAGHREVDYRAGDCPVAEERCASRDLSIYLGPNLYRESPDHLADIVTAFHKVTAGLPQLRALSMPAGGH